MTDANVSLQILYIPALAAKDKVPECMVLKDTNEVIGDPFIPPFAPGKLICELPPSHSLIYNKFHYVKNHLLIITKEFEDQFSSLTCEDWNQALLMIKTLKGMIFFNGGNNAGYSQRHKHMQVLP